MPIKENNNNFDTYQNSEDIDISLLSIQAAIELDKIILEKSNSIDSVLKLANYLKNSFQLMSDVPQQFYDIKSVAVVSNAYDTSQWGEKIKTVPELIKKASEIAGFLESTNSSDKDHDELIKMRDFCLALSNCTLSNQPRLNDLRPQPDYYR